MTLFYTKETASTLTQSQAEKALKAIEKAYDLDKPLTQCFDKQLWNDLDDIVDSILYLEDRIKQVKVNEQMDSIRHTRKETV